MKQLIKIKSVTDVITNSSTEIFTIYNKGAINKIKEMVNSIKLVSRELHPSGWRGIETYPFIVKH